MRQHHFPGGDKSPPPGSLRVWQWRMLGSLASGSNPRWGWAESVYSGHWGRGSWDRQPLGAGQVERSQGDLGSGLSASSPALAKPLHLSGPASRSERMGG